MIASSRSASLTDRAEVGSSMIRMRASQRQRLGDLDQLLLADAQRAHRASPGEAVKFSGCQQLGRAPVSCRRSIDEDRAADLLAPEEDVLGHGHARHEIELLVDDRDAVLGGVARAG